ncbi:MAG: ribosome silencing factor [Myxococcota bacterium]
MTHSTDSLSSIALAKVCASVVADKKAKQVCILDLRGLASYTDCLMICSGISSRHVTTLGQYLTQHLAQKGKRPVGVEGETSCNWVLVDYGDVVAHMFDEETRLHYDLEGLWADAPRIAWENSHSTLHF